MSQSLKPLYERWRPITFSEVVGQDRALKRITCLQSQSGLAGRAYWLAGPSGTGKSTIAKLIAADVADGMNIDEIDATGLSAAAASVDDLLAFLRPQTPELSGAEPAAC